MSFSHILTFLSFNLKSTFLQKRQILNQLIFLAVCLSLFPISLGPNPEILKQFGSAIVWILILFTISLNRHKTLADDFDSGVLEQYLFAPIPFSMILFLKGLVELLTHGIIVFGFMIIFCLSFDFHDDDYRHFILTTLLSLPALTYLSMLTSSLTIHRSKMIFLTPLITLPIFIPILILSVGSLKDSHISFSSSTPLFFLGALDLMIIPLSCYLSSKILQETF